MVRYQNVIVLQDKVTFRESLVQELTEHGFAVRSCGGVLGFCQLYAMRPVPVVILVSVPHMLCEYASKIREKAPLAAIVALGCDINAGWRICIMVAGADACHDVFADIRELTAIFSAWRRHARFAMHMKAKAAAKGAKAASAPWRLTANGRVLASPHGHTLPLTDLESGFLKRIAASDGHLIHRHKRVIGKAFCPNTREIRNVDVLVSRLRRKARHVGIDLPLLAVRGCGYLFTEYLDMSTPACTESGGIFVKPKPTLAIGARYGKGV